MKPRLKTLPNRIPTLKPQVKTIEPGSWRTGKTTAERGYGWRWQKAREQFLADNPLCAMHKEKGQSVVATVVDHIKAHRGDQELFWDKSNWQSLCKECHDNHAQRRDQKDFYGIDIG